MNAHEYNLMAVDYFHDLIFNDTENFRHREIEDNLKEQYGKDFEMNKFIQALDTVERKIYVALGEISNG